jgi:cephalosporin hydroxylase
VPGTSLRRKVVTRVDAAVRSRFATLAARVPIVADDATEQAAIAAFTALWDPARGAPGDAVRDAVVERFHQLYYNSPRRTWQGATTYRGTVIWKCPLDLWLYQELLDAVRPKLIIETGTAYGGSARYLADLSATLGLGATVVTIDTQVFADRYEHPDVVYLTGSSVSDEVLDRVRTLVPDDGAVMVILDSDHRRDHVLAELRCLAPLVTPGSVVVVEDTNVNGHPVYADFGPGPMEALDAYLAETDAFEVDPVSDKFFMTFNPRGVLRRVR